jgi:hypothetical protein
MLVSRLTQHSFFADLFFDIRTGCSGFTGGDLRQNRSVAEKDRQGQSVGLVEASQFTELVCGSLQIDRRINVCLFLNKS